MEVTPIELVRCTCCAALSVAELRRNWPGVPAGELSGEPTLRVRGAGYGAALFARCARACDGEPRSLKASSSSPRWREQERRHVEPGLLQA